MAINTENLVTLDNYSEDNAKRLLGGATKDNILKIIGISKTTWKPIVLKRSHIQKFIKNFPDSVLISLHDGSYDHNAFQEFPDFRDIHYSELWVNEILANKFLGINSSKKLFKKSAPQHRSKWQELANNISSENPRWKKARVADEIHARELKENPNFAFSVETIKRNFVKRKSSKK